MGMGIAWLSEWQDDDMWQQIHHIKDRFGK